MIDFVGGIEQVAAALRIAGITPGAGGNFQFCAAFNVPPGIPFFPAAYHDGGATSFAVGCESANVLDAAITAGAPADLERAHAFINKCGGDMQRVEAAAEEMAALERRRHDALKSELETELAAVNSEVEEAQRRADAAYGPLRLR